MTPWGYVGVICFGFWVGILSAGPMCPAFLSESSPSPKGSDNPGYFGAAQSEAREPFSGLLESHPPHVSADVDKVTALWAAPLGVVD